MCRLLDQQRSLKHHADIESVDYYLSSFFVGGVRPWPQELRRRPNDLFQNTLTRPTRNAAGQVGVQMGMYAPQPPPAPAGIRPRPSASVRPSVAPHSTALLLRSDVRAAKRRSGETGAQTDRGPRFSAAAAAVCCCCMRSVWDGETRSAAVGAIRRSLRSIGDNFAAVSLTRRCHLGKRWHRRGLRGSPRPPAAGFEAQTLQVEEPAAAMLSAYRATAVGGGARR